MRNKSFIENGVRVRKPANEAEGLCFDYMVSKGWTCTKKGWADFFCFMGKRFCCVEVKPSIRQNLKREQHVIMKALQSKGIECYVWTPETSLIPYAQFNETRNKYINNKR